MAGDWIPMRIDLYRDPAVIRIAGRLRVRPEMVVGYLHRVWGWFSEQTSNGDSGLPSQSIDAALNLPGFCAEMLQENWLRIDDNGNVKVPKWDRWNSQSAKQRILNSRRQRNARVAQMSRSQRDKSATTEQNRREKKKKQKEKADAAPISSGESAASARRTPLPDRDGPDPQVLADLRQVEQLMTQGLSRAEALAKLDDDGQG